MYYVIYKTINKINNKFYIGAHKTSNINDKYLGSGTLLLKAIKKYGTKNFEKKILYVFNNENDMYNKEAELVTEELIKSSKNYNAKTGGIGGWDHINTGDAAHIERCKKGGKKAMKKLLQYLKENPHKRQPVPDQKHANECKKIDMLQNPEKYKKIYKKLSEKQKENNSMKNKSWFVQENATSIDNKKVFDVNNAPDGWITTKEWKRRKMKKNSTFGKIWICCDLSGETKYIDNIEDMPHNWRRGRILVPKQK